jgi:BioD-like phosphotransacetylase family protein
MSIEPFSGKTATCLVFGKRLQGDGFRVSYLKPISLQPWRIDNHIADEDAAFVKEVLRLPDPAWKLSSIVITQESLRDIIQRDLQLDLIDKIKTICDKAEKEYDVFLVEGGSNLSEGSLVGLPSSIFANKFRCQILVLIRYHSDIQLLDDALGAKSHLGESMHGIIINRALEDAQKFVQEYAVPYLEKRSIPVFGVLPETRNLAAMTVGEIAQQLNAEVLTKTIQNQAVVENLTVGAMTADTALSRFRKQMNKAVITGGDRTDIQLAALETSTTCLILTGNLHPSPLIIKQADEFGVTILLVPFNTMETIDSIEHVFGKTRLHQPDKLKQFEDLFNKNVNYERLLESFNLR